MKTNIIVEYLGNQVDVKLIETKVRDIWKEEGKLVKDIKTLDIYYKPEESKVYYVVNGNSSETYSLNL